MRDSSVVERLTWLSAISADSRLHSTAIRVAVVIASYLNRLTGEAFPSIRTIATKSATPARSVERAISELCKAGYLERRRSRFQGPNVYSIPGTSPHHKKADLEASAATVGGYETSDPAKDDGIDNLNSATGDETFPPHVTVQSCHEWRPNPSRTDYLNTEDSHLSHSRVVLTRNGKAEDPNFERFWALFPRKEDKGTARKAWAKAIKMADANIILAGAEHYAMLRKNQEPRFTKLPATWLNAEAWQNETMPPAPARLTASGSAKSAKEETGAAIRCLLNGST